MTRHELSELWEKSFPVHIGVEDPTKTVNLETKYTPPYHVGRKQKRAVMDSMGREVVVFHKGDESMAQEYCDFLNGKMKTIMSDEYGPSNYVGK